MTEKDAVKCRAFAARDLFGSPIRAQSTTALVDLVLSLSMDAKLLEILVCPVSKGPLVYRKPARSSSARPTASPIRSGTASR